MFGQSEMRPLAATHWPCVHVHEVVCAYQVMIAVAMAMVVAVVTTSSGWRGARGKVGSDGDGECSRQLKPLDEE